MQKTFKTKGTCSSEIELDIKDGIIRNVCFKGGCSGNLKAVAALVNGMNANDAISRLKGIKCGTRSTSCPDQLANAIELHISSS